MRKEVAHQRELLISAFRYGSMYLQSERYKAQHSFNSLITVLNQMDDPKYGTEPPENIPFLSNLPSHVGFSARVLAGTVILPVPDSKPVTAVGPFKTVQEVYTLFSMLT